MVCELYLNKCLYIYIFFNVSYRIRLTKLESLRDTTLSKPPNLPVPQYTNLSMGILTAPISWGCSEG